MWRRDFQEAAEVAGPVAGSRALPSGAGEPRRPHQGFEQLPLVFVQALGGRLLQRTLLAQLLEEPLLP